MKTFYRLLAISIIITSVLSILLALFTIINIWKIQDPLTRALSEIAAYAETGLGFANNALPKIDKLLSLLEQSMQDIQANGEKLKSDIENSDPIIDTLALLIGEDAAPKVEQAMKALNDVRSTVETINTVTQSLNALPFIQIPSIAQQMQQISDVLTQIDDTLKEMSEKINKLKQGVSTAVIQPIQDQALIIEEDLAAAQEDLQVVQQQVDTAYTIVEAIRPKIPAIITGISIFLSVQLFWSMLTQAAAIYLAWIYLKVGHLDVYRMLSASETKNNADDVSATVSNPKEIGTSESSETTS